MRAGHRPGARRGPADSGGGLIYLASRSPRRRELLSQIGVRFEALLFREGTREDAETSEAVLAGEQPEDYVVLGLLAADTTVSLTGEILAKPVDRDDAARMLRLLSGTQHRVLTAVAVMLEQRVEMAVSESLVTFAALDEQRVAAYIQSGEPFDKAGAYGIQGRAAAFVERLEGSYSGVMGLPLYETANLLRLFGVTVP
jgi:septum formation protein